MWNTNYYSYMVVGAPVVGAAVEGGPLVVGFWHPLIPLSIHC